MESNGSESLCESMSIFLFEFHLLPDFLLVYLKVGGPDEELLVAGAGNMAEDVLKGVGNNAPLVRVVPDTWKGGNGESQVG